MPCGAGEHHTSTWWSLTGARHYSGGPWNMQNWQQLMHPSTIFHAKLLFLVLVHPLAGARASTDRPAANTARQRARGQVFKTQEKPDFGKYSPWWWRVCSAPDKPASQRHPETARPEGVEHLIGYRGPGEAAHWLKYSKLLRPLNPWALSYGGDWLVDASIKDRARDRSRPYKRLPMRKPTKFLKHDILEYL